MDPEPSVSPRLVSLLSASSFAVPDGPSLLEDPTILQPIRDTETTAQAEVVAVSPDTAESGIPQRVTRKRGRPRKTPDDGAGLTPKERRRVQVLKAQRAYQSRKEVKVSNQEDRISKLEATVLKMNSLVAQLGDQLADTIASQPHLMSNLRDTVAACAYLAKQVDQGEKEGSPPSPRVHTLSSVLSHLERNRSLLPSPKGPLQGTSLSPQVQGAIPSSRSLMSLQSPSSSDTSARPRLMAPSPVELSTFISQLRLACAYNAFETLNNPKVALDIIQNKYRFLLSLMSRQHLTSYYKAALESQVDQSAMMRWEAVPFFGLGGAGSHYPRPASSTPRGSEGSSTNHDSLQVDDPLLAFTAEIRENLDDTWFDASDLEGYLEEGKACLVVRPPSMPKHEDLPTNIDVVKLLQVLVSCCVCLGRSPGWRRRDVEEAVRKATSV